MIYQQFDPHPALKDYVDAYWTATGDSKELQTERILPDGCIDIIFNLGDDCIVDNGNATLQHEKVYLVGTMTRFKDNSISSGAHIFGIRFKPAAFSAFYQFDVLHEITDQTIEFDKKFSPDLAKTIHYTTDYLNEFLLSRLIKPKHNLLSIVADIQDHKGQLSVVTLAQRHYVTTRQLERNFKAHIGITPKEFINLVRYQFTLPLIKDKSSVTSLADISFDQGYYDHAHLTNEIRRYTGLTPSQF